MDNSNAKKNQFYFQEKLREEKVLSELYQISSSELEYKERINKTLEVGKTYFDLDLGIVSKIDGEEYLVKFISENPNVQENHCFELGKTYCSHIFGQPEVASWSDAGNSEIAKYPCYQGFQLNTYIGTTIFVNNSPYGTINFTSEPKRDQPFSEREKYFVKLMAQFVANEISSQIAKEEKEELIKQLKETNEQIEEFTYIASHDLKTPIRGIYHYTQFLEEDFKDELPKEAQEMIVGIKKLTSRMNDLVDEVLSYSKAQRADLEMQTFNLGDVIRVIEIDLASQPDIEIDISFSKMPDVKADIVGIKEVLHNFITNAYKYNDSERREIKFEFNNDSKELLISDNGIGIEKKDQDKVFSFFKRIHGKDEYGGGTGAGLAIVKKILERQRITIEMESEVGEGTIFKLDLNEVLVFSKLD
jgi:signal transduction histidine kinase